MRRLSVAQANRCENAQYPQCRCRCGGALHGVARVAGERLDTLSEDDPHFASTERIAKHLARQESKS